MTIQGNAGEKRNLIFSCVDVSIDDSIFASAISSCYLSMTTGSLLLLFVLLCTCIIMST